MRLIDADKVKFKFPHGFDNNGILMVPYHSCKCSLDNSPTIDAVPVVRCRNCEHAEPYARTDGTAGYYCGHPQNAFVYGERWDRVFKPVKNPDDFCSYGKRMEPK